MRYRTVVIWAAAISLSFSLGFITNVSDNYFEISKNLDIFGKLYREINALYVDDTDPTDLIRTGIDAMLNSLDPYTNYISEEELEDFRFMSTGEYGGIGAVIGKRDKRILVMDSYDGYPADLAGLEIGDEILKIDGKEVDGTEMEVLDVRNLLRGEKGSMVTLEVKKSEEENDLATLKISRDRIRVNNVAYSGMLNESVGYISLQGFTQDAAAEVEKAIQDFKENHSTFESLILDLRNNPGGRLDEAVKVANIFIPQKEKIVETRGRIDGSHRTHYAKSPPVDAEIPLAVLINGRSASASEIVTGAIQDLDRGIVVGQRSFGKGLVQNIRPLSYNAQLKVTTAKYYTPSGRCIQAVNYTHDHGDSKAERIPDSSRNHFTTRNGRSVYDGGGIEPDVYVPQNKPKTVSRALVNQGYIYDYASLYADKHPAIPEAAKFVVSDEMYDDFVAYLESKKFSYETTADGKLKELKKTVSSEAYYDKVGETLNELSQMLSHFKRQDVEKYKEEIKKYLKQEILKRYYHEKGVIEGQLNGDPVVEEAIEWLTNLNGYNQMLTQEGQ